MGAKAILCSLFLVASVSASCGVDSGDSRTSFGGSSSDASKDALSQDGSTDHKEPGKDVGDALSDLATESSTEAFAEASAEAGPDPCAPIPGTSYSTGSVVPATFHPESHGDCNLLLRTWKSVAETKGLIDVGGDTDDKAPRLYTLFVDDRMPVFAEVYQVQGWDWGCNCAVDYMTDPPVTLAGFAVEVGEVIQLPRGDRYIGADYQALMLYAADNTITLKYTRDDNVVSGYTIHMANLCVEPSLRALYDDCHAKGRNELPQLRGDEAIGRARTTQVLVAIRDTGSWMDPRVKKDWYHP